VAGIRREASKKGSRFRITLAEGRMLLAGYSGQSAQYHIVLALYGGISASFIVKRQGAEISAGTFRRHVEGWITLFVASVSRKEAR